MNKDIRYYEVEITFLAPTGAFVPVTASSEDEAKEIALYLFRDHSNIEVKSIRDISQDPNQPAQPLLN